MKALQLALFLCFVFLGIHSQNTNLDFEASPAGSYSTGTSVSGWSLSSQVYSICGQNNWISGSAEFSIVSTPSLSYPVLGVLPNSPLGGTQIAVLNDLSPNQHATRLSRTYSVVSNNCLLDFAFAGIWEDCGTTTCCEHSGFQFVISDNNGPITCKSYTMTANQNCRWPGITYSTTVYNSQTVTYTNWQHMYVDLTPFIGTTVNIVVTSLECTAGAHAGSLLFDIKSGNIICDMCADPGMFTSFTPTVSFCNGSSNAIINGPLGYSTYSWTAPGAYPISASQTTLANLTLTNAVAGSVYTLATTNFWSPCVHVGTYTLTSGSLGASTIWTKNSCPLGSSGSATVSGNGSGAGYTYVWANASNSVISTNAVVNNLAPGVYNVSVTAAGSASSTCGIAVNNVTILPTLSPPQTLIQLYCNNPFTLCAPPNGTNYQWYSGFTAIGGSSGGTAACLPVLTPTNGSTFRLGINTIQGCRDSLIYLLYATNPGSLSLISTPLACQNIANGSAIFSLSPAPGSGTNSLSYTITSIGSSPSYSSVIGPGAPPSFTAVALSPGGQYAVNASDGVCAYSKTVTVNTYAFDYNLNPLGSPTVCNGSFLAAGVSFSSTPVQGLYSYSWSPGNYIIAGLQSQNALMSASLAPGTQTTVTYSVVVNPTVINCPLSKTLSVTFIHPASPTVNAIPLLCDNGDQYTINVSPPGGTFNGPFGLSSNGVITPSLSQSVNTLTYTAPQTHTCTAPTTTASYVIAPSPGNMYAITGNNQICSGQSSTLSMGGGLTYSWSTGSTSSLIVISPSVNTMYTGTATYSNSGCSSTYTQMVIVTPQPSLSIAGPSLVCAGDTALLIATGANNYTWSINQTGSNVAVSPSASDSYTVWANNSYSCPTISMVHTLVVAPKPVISISGNTSVCQGQPLSLTANGATSFTWNNSYSGSLFTSNPVNSTVYTITGLDAATNCTNTSTLTIQVINYPTLSFTGDTSICNGESTLLNVSGALNFLWDDGSTTSYLNVSPGLSTSYTVTGTTNSACVSTLVIPVNVYICTNLERAGSQGAFNVYPNPGNGIFYIALPVAFACEVQIYDALGRLCFSTKHEQELFLLDLRNFENGTYLLRILSDNHNSVHPILKVD